MVEVGKNGLAVGGQHFMGAGKLPPSLQASVCGAFREVAAVVPLARPLYQVGGEDVGGGIGVGRCRLPE
ncbi:MAG: hypothetical protein O2884_12895 [Chloroflexi bacterium]|nr:hypothetical protein [Chloroflexota bacterium]